MGVRRDRAIGAVLAVLVLGAAALGLGRGVASGSSSTPGGGGSPAGGAAGPANENTPRVPHNNVAAIYDLFGARDEAVLKDIAARLDSEGYKVEWYQDTIQGSGPGHGNATLDSFVKMADTASVIVINTHGEDFSGTTQSCGTGKGISHCAAIADPSAPTTPTTPPRPERSTIVQPFLQVEWYQTWEEVQQAYDRYIRSGVYKEEWLFDPTVFTPPSPAATLVPFRIGDWAPDDGTGQQNRKGFGYRPYLGITKAGIEHFFKGKKIDLIDNMACHSISMATAFDARSYFGHANTGCTNFQDQDEPKLFDRLVGKFGVAARPTDKAFALGGFTDQFFQLAPGSTPVVLSPAVKKVSPREGGSVKPGKRTAASITFDAAMSQQSADGIVSVSGCRAKVENPKWASDTELRFDLTIPKGKPGQSMTVTVHQDKAIADPGDADNHHLDGNQEPADRSGVAPNRDDYVYRLACTNVAVVNVEVRYTGTLRSDFTEGGLSYHVNFTWDEVQVASFRFNRGAVEYLPPEPPTLTASGTATSSGRTGAPDDACSYTAVPAPATTITINAREDPAATGGRVRTVDVIADFPGSTGHASNLPGVGRLLATGTCNIESISGPEPYLFYHPSGNYDPGGTLGLAQAPRVDGIDLAKIAASPVTLEFPFEYTQSSGAGAERVYGQSTLTVTLR